MPDARVQAAIENWGPRFIANGVDYNDFIRITTAITRWDAVARRLVGHGAEVHEELAARARSEGHLRTAGEAFLRAAVSYHFAEVRVGASTPSATVEPPRPPSERCTSALALLDPTAERIEAPLPTAAWPSGTCAARTGERPLPVVILIPGLDSTKEEFLDWESVFLDRGMATLSLDGPGPGRDRLHRRHPARLRGRGCRGARCARRAARSRPRPGRRGRGQPRRLLRPAQRRLRAAHQSGRRRQRTLRSRRRCGRRCRR